MWKKEQITQFRWIRGPRHVSSIYSNGKKFMNTKARVPVSKDLHLLESQIRQCTVALTKVS